MFDRTIALSCSTVFPFISLGQGLRQEKRAFHMRKEFFYQSDYHNLPTFPRTG